MSERQMETCVSEETLRDYLSSRLRPEQDAGVLTHVESCTTCFHLMESLCAESKLEELAKKMDEGPYDDPSADFLNRLCAISDDNPSRPTVLVDGPSKKNRKDGRSGPARTAKSSDKHQTATTEEYETAGPRRFGQYELRCKLGRGGMGTVYEGYHPKLRRPVAIKVLTSERMGDPTTRVRFAREMAVVGRLDHPHIVRAYDAGEVNGRSFLVMEFVDGLDLAKIVHWNGTLSVSDACECARQVALGLEYVCEQGLVHRDVKPSNILVSQDGQVKLADLGLARTERATGDWQTATGQLMGSVDYMAPEQAKHVHDVDIRADLYGLGCTLYHLLAGQPPFGDPSYDSVLKKIYAHAQEPIPHISQFRTDVPDALAQVLDKLLAKNPDDRYRTPVEAAHALETIADGPDLTALVASTRSRMPAHSGTADDLSELGELASASIEAESLPSANDATNRPIKKLLAIIIGIAIALMGAAVFHSIVAPPNRQLERDVGSLDGDAPPGPPIRLELDDHQSDLWRTALGRNPQELYWPKHLGQGDWGFDRDGRTLHLTSDDVRLLSFGRMPASTFTLSVDIQQPRWTGDVGLFFGYREEKFLGKPCARFQLIWLHWGTQGDGQPTMRMARCKMVLVFEDDEMLPEYEQNIPVIWQDAQGTRLTLAVQDNTLTQILIGNQNLDDLVSEKVNRQFDEANFVGQWGLLIRQTTAWFNNPQLTLSQEKHP